MVCGVLLFTPLRFYQDKSFTPAYARSTGYGKPVRKFFEYLPLIFNCACKRKWLCRVYKAGTLIISTTPPDNHTAPTFPFKRRSKASLPTLSACLYRHCQELTMRTEKQHRFKLHKWLTESSTKV